MLILTVFSSLLTIIYLVQLSKRNGHNDEDAFPIKNTYSITAKKTFLLVMAIVLMKQPIVLELDEIDLLLKPPLICKNLQRNFPLSELTVQLRSRSVAYSSFFHSKANGDQNIFDLCTYIIQPTKGILIHKLNYLKLNTRLTRFNHHLKDLMLHLT